MALFDLLAQMGAAIPRQEEAGSTQILKQVTRPRRIGALKESLAQGYSAPQVTPQEQALVQAPPPEPQLTQHSGGFMSRLKDALVGMTLMGPGGFVAGLANPQLVHQARLNLIDMPRYQAGQKFQSQQDTARTQRAVELGGMSGVNPLTGQPTIQANKLEEQAQRWDALNQLKEMQLNNQLTIAGMNLQQKEEALASREEMAKNQFLFNRGKLQAQQTLKDWREGRTSLDPKKRQLIQDTIGYDLTDAPDKVDPMLHFPFVDESGTVRIIPVPKGQTSTTVIPGAGKPSPPSTTGQVTEKDLEQMAEQETARRMGAKPTEKDRQRATFWKQPDPLEAYQKDFDRIKEETKARLREQLGGRAAAAPPAARNTITQAQYQQMVKDLGKERADAALNRRGIKVQ